MNKDIDTEMNPLPGLVNINGKSGSNAKNENIEPFRNNQYMD